jgi:hypothetical protein
MPRNLLILIAARMARKAALLDLGYNLGTVTSCVVRSIVPFPDTQIGENQEALPITARILALIPDYDSVIFSEYMRIVDRAEDVLRFGLPEGRRAAKSWLQFLIQAGRLGDAQRPWDWVVGHGYADSALAGEYVEFLIRQGHPDWTASAWA